MNPISYRRFACPKAGGDDWMSAIAVVHGLAALQMLLERERASILPRTEGLVGLLENWATSPNIEFETVWDVSFGRVVRALESNEIDPVDVLAEVGLRLAAVGIAGQWSATLCEERRLAWDHRWLLPRASRISVNSDGVEASVEVTASDDSRWSNRFIRNEQSGSAEGVERMIQIGARRPVTLWSPQAVPRDMIFEDDFHSIFEFPEDTSSLAPVFSQALQILQRDAPEYLDWVETVLRGILICRCQESRTRSSSWMHAPGIILVSWSPNPIELAEMLVHECSHQYFYLLSRVGPVADDSDTQQYFSPAVKRNRPLSKLVIGYHAFANIVLFYRRLLQSGFAGDPYCTSIESRLTNELDVFEGPLRDNPALTSPGRDLCEPLMEQVHLTRVARAGV